MLKSIVELVCSYFRPNKPMDWGQRLQINLVRVNWIELTTNLAPPILCRCHKPESAPVLQKVTMEAVNNYRLKHF